MYKYTHIKDPYVYTLQCTSDNYHLTFVCNLFIFVISQSDTARLFVHLYLSYDL